MSKRYLVLAIFIAALGGCASSQPHLYQGIASSAQMSVNSNDRSQKTPFAFAGDLRKLASHSSVVLEPIAIYRGPDNQFDRLSGAQIQELSVYAERTFSEALSKHGILADQSSPTALRLRIVLTGARLSVPVLGTVSKVTPVGFALSGVKAMAGKEGRFIGDVIYVAEFRDGTSGELLQAYISKQFPSAVDVGASVRPLDAAKIGIRQGADTLAKDIAQRLSSAR
ncbi:MULTISPECIES: DUF3313 domain-containing protein [Alphaproteobacteria]|uniref:Lipoprotein n=2 Tax=Alphaproteobacteria TaxID=28211 RepID=A0A512HNS2_9HYPH|nr:MULTISPECIES: DUF3313 domain-containing protein [Alphaproteobacteria]GEO87079.1 lipoprotein [Ciceribacter naphthalenivorans]GLR23135.1 lipoprotein [Ciceribacter naphthalenivorans]GLT05991.1 lipoprotein [Sphingomonas psychrolutea]